MKKIKMLVITLLAVLSSLTATQAQTTATSVKFYFYPVALPNSDNTLEFGTARDNLLTAIKFGGKSFTTAGTRMGTNANNVTAIEIKNVFDVSDLVVSSSTNLWRGQFSPPAPFNAQYGNRPYVSTVAVAEGGQICLTPFSCYVSCGNIQGLGNNSSLAGLNYSVSRIGVKAGPDGILFTSDDTIINSGPGTVLVDAIVYIGGRAGAVGNNQLQIDTVNTAVGEGTWLRWDYYYTCNPTNTSHGGITIPLYQSGGVPWAESYNRIVPFIGPVGVIFSVVGQPGSPYMSMYGSRKVTGPFYLVNDKVTEGTAAFWPYTHNGTNDYGYYRLSQSNMTKASNHSSLRVSSTVVGSVKDITPSFSTELDQDKPAK